MTSWEWGAWKWRWKYYLCFLFYWMLILMYAPLTFVYMWVPTAGLCRRCHREAPGAGSGKRSHRGTASKIQGEILWPQHCSLPFSVILKGDIGGKIHFYMVLAYKCVLAVCGHNNYPTMIKINSLFFFLSPKNLNSLNYQAVFIFWAGPTHNCWRTVLY